MTQPASKLAMPLQIPLMTLVMIALAASTLLAPRHDIRPGYAVAANVAPARATPYGSSAALRNLLF